MWPFWQGGIALALIPLAHLLLVRRALGVSGRYSELVDAAVPASAQAPLDPELARALLEATIEEFGAEKVQAAQAQAAAPQTWHDHTLFLLALLVGGALSVFLSGTEATVPSGDLPSAPWLLGGGVLVGVGTRMAAGCTSGHGLVGLSRFQKGSIVATCCFFGAGVATALLFDVLA